MLETQFVNGDKPGLPSARWLWVQAAIALVLSFAGNVAVLYIARSMLPFFEPLQLPNVIVWSVGSVLGAVLTYQYILRRSATPQRTFINVAWVVLLVSFIPNVVFFWVDPGPRVGTPTTGGIFALMFMHVVAAAIIVPLLLRKPTAQWALAKPLEWQLQLSSGDSTTKSPIAVALVVLFATAITASAYLGYKSLLFTFLFASPAIAGLVLWFAFPTRVTFTQIRVPYLLCIALFILHLTEERLTNYMPILFELTGSARPPKGSIYGTVLSLTLLTWIVGPFLLRRNYSVGIYFAWTFFAAMGIAEMAHFYYPFMRGGSYGYFPGMLTQVLLAPAAWWGMWRIAMADKKQIVPVPGAAQGQPI